MFEHRHNFFVILMHFIAISQVEKIKKTCCIIHKYPHKTQQRKENKDIQNEVEDVRFIV